jgi:hypothetical protein
MAVAQAGSAAVASRPLVKGGVTNYTNWHELIFSLCVLRVLGGWLLLGWVFDEAHPPLEFR